MNDFGISVEEFKAHWSSLVKDATRWRWLREQEGWPWSENEASCKPPEWFDEMADKAMKDEEGA